MTVAIHGSVGPGSFQRVSALRGHSIARDMAKPAIIDRWTYLSGELLDGYMLRGRLRVHIYREGDEYVASLARVPIIAFGTSDADALQVLRSQIVEHLLWLEEAEEKLRPRLKREREQMRSFMQETHG